jgi:DNA-binding transcriptional regulator YiaG
MKFCIDKYPMGSWKGQKSPGKYMDAFLHKNLELYAEKISQDMTFLGIIFSSTLEVGTGKSVLATQIGEAWTEIVNKKYNLNIPYNVDNIVWRPKELIEKSFNVPKYSFILLDEWEDSSYWSELGISLRQFFRKCRQLNLFMICIIPNWFQLPLSYAISRSIFAIDVKFDNNLDRGKFSFYNFPAKRMLYINGKKQHNYKVCRPTFNGEFPDGYGVDEKEYRQRKYEDMVKYEKEHPEKLSSAQLIMKTRIEMFKQISKNLPKLTNEELANMIGVSSRTIIRWKQGDVDNVILPSDNYTIGTEKKELFVDEERLESNPDSEYIGADDE